MGAVKVEPSETEEERSSVSYVTDEKTESVSLTIGEKRRLKCEVCEAILCTEFVATF